MSEGQPVAQEKHITFDDLTAEFDKWKSGLDETAQQQPRLWSTFLLNRPDDGSWVYARSMDDTIQGNNNEITRLVKAGKITEAQALGSLTSQMDARYASMWKQEQAVGGGVRSIRAISPIPIQK